MDFLFCSEGITVAPAPTVLPSIWDFYIPRRSATPNFLPDRRHHEAQSNTNRSRSTPPTMRPSNFHDVSTRTPTATMPKRAAIQSPLCCPYMSSPPSNDRVTHPENEITSLLRGAFFQSPTACLYTESSPNPVSASHMYSAFQHIRSLYPQVSQAYIFDTMSHSLLNAIHPNPQGCGRQGIQQLPVDPYRSIVTHPTHPYITVAHTTTLTDLVYTHNISLIHDPYIMHYQPSASEPPLILVTAKGQFGLPTRSTNEDGDSSGSGFGYVTAEAAVRHYLKTNATSIKTRACILRRIADFFCHRSSWCAGCGRQIVPVNPSLSTVAALPLVLQDLWGPEREVVNHCIPCAEDLLKSWYQAIRQALLSSSATSQLSPLLKWAHTAFASINAAPSYQNYMNYLFEGHLQALWPEVFATPEQVTVSKPSRPTRTSSSRVFKFPPLLPKDIETSTDRKRPRSPSTSYGTVSRPLAPITPERPSKRQRIDEVEASLRLPSFSEILALPIPMLSDGSPKADLAPLHNSRVDRKVYIDSIRTHHLAWAHLLSLLSQASTTDEQREALLRYLLKEWLLTSDKSSASPLLFEHWSVQAREHAYTHLNRALSWVKNHSTRTLLARLLSDASTWLLPADSIQQQRNVDADFRKQYEKLSVNWASNEWRQLEIASTVPLFMTSMNDCVCGSNVDIALSQPRQRGNEVRYCDSCHAVTVSPLLAERLAWPARV